MDPIFELARHHFLSIGVRKNSKLARYHYLSISIRKNFNDN